MATFILTDEFKKRLEKQEVISALAQKGYNSIDDFTREILRRLNEFDTNLNLSSIAYHTLQDTDTYIGVILDEFLNKQYNVCIIPPKMGTRSGFLSQQIFGFISNLINGQQTSESYTICDKPVIIVNCMVDSLANSAICNIIGSKIIGFEYIDIFNRNEGSHISNLSDFVKTVSKYKKSISQDIELQDDTLILRTERLKNFSTSLTNEPYYFAINAYPAVILAKKEGYKIDSSDFETKLAAGISNKNIQAFVRFLKGLKAANFPQRSKIIIDPLQRIYYGAPGTGKSNEIKLLTGEGKDGIKFSKNFTFRTTFHPDSDYSSFLGCYKPTQKERIVNYKSWEELKQIADNLPVDNGEKVKAIVNFIRENAESIKKVIEEKGYDNFSYIFSGSSQENTDHDSERFCWSSNSYLGSFLDEILKERQDNYNGQLTYAFTPQAFTKAYVTAWTHPNENVALVIEEINRGNCAQIFGDIFQLLDRESNGLSKYPIEADIDMQAYLNKRLANLNDIFDDELKAAINKYYEKHYDTAFEDIKCGKILTLPTNLSILCTMNTSDQSLFPMDSAFKRRWDWQYMPIKNGGLDWKIELSENCVKIDWWEFLKRINKVVADLTISEDKQLGYFFCQPDSFVEREGVRGYNDKPNLITAKHFVDKVIFYLWNDVFKDYAFDASCCKDENGKEVLFAQFYNEDGKSVNIDTLKHFFESLQSDNEPSLVEEMPTETQDESEVE